ncbi:MAG: ABC transporter permease, partial [Gammaproteobacteria bacterium]
MFRALYKLELIGLFRTPFAWVLLGIGAALIAFQFLAQIELYFSIAQKLRGLEEAPGATELIVVPAVGFCAMLVTFLVPIVTMQSIGGDKRRGTIQLIGSSPVNMWLFVIAKFLGLSTLFLLLWIIIATMMMSLLWGTQLDLGLCLGALLAIIVYTLAAISIGLCVSALIEHAVAAGAMTLALLLFLWFCDWSSKTGGEINFFTHLASSRHFTRLASGLFDSFDLAYFVV